MTERKPTYKSTNTPADTCVLVLCGSAAEIAPADAALFCSPAEFADILRVPEYPENSGNDHLSGSEPGPICAWLNEHHPGKSALIIPGAMLHGTVDMQALWQVLAGSKAIGGVTTFGNRDARLDPLNGLENTNPHLANALPALMPTGWFELGTWPENALLLSANAIGIVASEVPGQQGAHDRLQAAGLSLVCLAGHYQHSADKPVGGSGNRAEEVPLPVKALRARLEAFIDTDLSDWQADQRPGILHITHSWGGGIARWVNDFASTADTRQHLILASSNNRLGDTHSLSLHKGSVASPAIRTWNLQPVIAATAITHRGYKAVLEEIIRDYPVSALLISSLVGHSLDACRTTLPTLQVVHDYYPSWPLLDHHPDNTLSESGEEAIDRAIREHIATSHFQQSEAAFWRRLRHDWLDAVKTHGIRIVAPSQSARDSLLAIQPELPGAQLSVQPHGVSPPETDAYPIKSRARPDGKLNLIVLGRIHPGKGKHLLLDALPELTELAHITLLGSGKDGEDFFGKSGVNVVYQYDPEELPDLLAELAPQAALLLSTVAETFSYTLSELSQAGIPVIATALGSFRERIDSESTGWLIDPTPDALIDQVKRLASDPGLLNTVRGELSRLPMVQPDDMVDHYLGLLNDAPNSVADLQALNQAEIQWQAGVVRNHELAQQLSEQKTRIETQLTELGRRADWGETLNRELKSAGKTIDRLNDELQTTQEWGAGLDLQIIDLNAHLAAKSELLDQARAEISNKEQTIADLTLLSDRLEQVLASRSWAITKPLRVGTRLLGNLRRWQVYNPRHWPRLLSGIRRQIATVGFSRAFRRLQDPPLNLTAPETPDIDIPEAPETPQPVALRADANPQVSVIIPVYNEVQHTQVCLESLMRAKTDTPFEVIVVDDCSDAETAEFLRDSSGFKLVTNTENQGFIRSCNRGREQAEAEFLLFLNNDTAVTDGWLDRLLDTFREFENCGIVGARLVFPDGTLQEAGGLIFQDGSGWNYGRNGAADDLRYQFARETDYVSGACLTIPASLFDSLGGFDEFYAPAYYEDTDLCFKCREAGMKVVVQNQAIVVHFEGASSGTDPGAGAKQYQTVNRHKFLDRWETQLTRQPEPIVDPEHEPTVLAAADHYYRGHVLFVDAYTPEPDHDSGSVRLGNLMACCRDLGYKVTFFADNLAYAGHYTHDLQARGIQVLHVPHLESVDAALTHLGDSLDAVFVSRHYIAEKYLEPVRRLCPNARFIFDTVDLHYLRETRLAELEQSRSLMRQAERTKKDELAVVAEADLTLVVSPIEVEVLEKDAPGAKVAIVSNIHPVMGSRRPFQQRRDIYFVGGYQHPPNIDAAIWFCQDVFPIIRQRLPSLQCYLIGSRAPSEIQALAGDGVVFRGFVQHLEPYLDGCRLSIAPLRYGAGVKGKVNMAMSYGQPVIATSVAAEGMFVEDGAELLIADEPQDFADAVIRAYQDSELWGRLSVNGLTNVERHFSYNAAKVSLRNILGQ